MSTTIETRKFFLSGNLTTWAEQQGRFPRSLFVRKGLVHLPDIAKAFPQSVLSLGKGIYLARLPIVVSADAALLIGKGETLRLAGDRGAFVVNAGQFFLMHGTLEGWHDGHGKPDWFSGDKHAFRAFYTGWSGSQTYMYGSTITHLGSATTKAYGISLSTFSEGDSIYAPPGIDMGKRPMGWIVNCHFEDMFYGFYSYEAEDVVILRNVYKNNYYYGIDPHDRSRRLIIAENRIWGTKVRHGIIGSREVDDSFIFRNISFHNHLAGIMLDRLSNRNIVANNITWGNGSDGIAMYESNDNILYANQVYDNADHGIRFRNSRNIRIVDNVITRNGKFGVYGHLKDLSYQTYRDFKLDPYEKKSSGTLYGGLIAFNKSGAVFAEDLDEMVFGHVLMDGNGGGIRPLKGGLVEKAPEILQAMQASQWVRWAPRDASQAGQP